MSATKSQDLAEQLLDYQGDATPLARIIRLHHDNRDLFYRVYALPTTPDLPGWLVELQDITKRLRRMSRNPLEITEAPDQVLIRAGSEQLKCDYQSVDRFRELWADITGIHTGPTPHPRHGRPVGASELEFKVGLDPTQTDPSQRLEDRARDKPVLLRLDEEDQVAVTSGMPAFIAHELRYCATRIVQAPEVVFQGLRARGFRKARAYCGRPSRCYDNHGGAHPAPEGKVYVVYVDEQNYVFDWDWVQSDSDNPAYPIDWQNRFKQPIAASGAVLVGVSNIEPSGFDPGRAWYSQRGNCVFVYFSDDPSYAERLNDDVTVFRRYNDFKIVGCKLKNIQKLEEEVGVEVLLAKSLVKHSETSTRQPETLEYPGRGAYLDLLRGISKTGPIVRVRAIDLDPPAEGHLPSILKNDHRAESPK